MNNQEIQNRTNFYQAENEETIDLRKIVFTTLRNWYWFVLSLIIFGGLAVAYNRYTMPVYEINSTMLFEDNYSTMSSPLSGGSGPVGDVFQGLGNMGSMKNIYNQLTILNSTPVIARTLDELGLEVSYYSVGRVISSESYKSTPFQVIWSKEHPQIIDIDFNLTISPNGKMILSAKEKNVSVYSYQDEKVLKIIPEFVFKKEISTGVMITSREFEFTLLLNEQFDPNAEYNAFKFRFQTKESLIKKYHDALEVTLPDKFSTVLNLTLHDFNQAKGVDFLNKLAEIYTLDNLGKKNENASRTIKFIDSQLSNISDSLSISQNRKQTFQSQNQVINISSQSEQLLTQMASLDNEKVALETQNKYYHYLKNYIQNNQELETVIAPSAMGIADPLLNSLILQLNELITLKSSQTSIRQNSNHPTILRLNAQIVGVKNSLLENTTNIIEQSDIALNDLNKRIRSFETQVRSLPATERNFVNIERNYQLNNEIYTFLLQKLSEAQIAKASNLPDSQVIENAKVSRQIEPKTMMIYGIAFVLGLAFPAVIIFLRNFFNNKIISEEEIEALTNYPIIGHVFHNENENGSSTPVLDKPNSPASEPYRSIRNKLNLITKGKDKPIIAVTSTAPNEGKSYNAINFASAFALARKKTVILDLDLRNSKMSENLNLNTDLGVVNYIIGKANVDEIIFDTKHPYLKLIPAGPIPPNPSEMLTDDKMMELINKLREQFDVIVIDTPPVGYVSDMFQLNEIIDSNIFVVRHKHTNKNALKTALEEVSKHHLKGIGIVVNDIKLDKSNYGYGYGYGYGNGYGYGYGNDKDQKSSKRRILKEEELT